MISVLMSQVRIPYGFAKGRMGQIRWQAFLGLLKISGVQDPFASERGVSLTAVIQGTVIR